MTALLSVRDLRVRLPSADGLVSVVEGIDFDVQRGQIVGLAGESGSGKTISVLALLGLLPPGSTVGGTAQFDGVDLIKLRNKAIREVRGRRIAIVLQDPLSSLHPMLTVERQLTEHMRVHLGVRKSVARARAVDLLGEVRIPDPVGALGAYPHQFSGGMRQRIAIAMALACEPQLLIADEPTTALDVTVQAGILRLIDRLRRQTGLSVIMITHDLGVLSAIADSLTVMYAGRVAEAGPTAAVLRSPRHPYTAGLVAALPSDANGHDARQPLIPINGSPPSIHARPPGCAFHPRCSFLHDACRVNIPEPIEVGDERRLACPVDPMVLAR